MKKLFSFFMAILFFYSSNYSYSQQDFIKDKSDVSIAHNVEENVEEKNSTIYQKNIDRNPSNKKYDNKAQETSSFESFVGGGVKQFGYDFFYKSPVSFIPDQNVPVTSDYIIGPGDQIVINVWGRINARWVVEVLRDGSISLPKMPPINPSGVKFSDLRDFLKREISKYYTDFDLNVSMGNLRSIRVYVVGNVKNPGAYTLSGLSTMINALFESGGPSKVGTMREIELKRNGKTISKLDLYDFFIKGDKTADLKLVNEDTIFVPPVGRLVAILNGVKNPGIYEIKKEEKLLDLIQMTGGFLNTAYNKKISIRRVFNNTYSDYMDVDISELTEGSTQNLDLNDGDIVSVNSILQFDSSINVYGAVLYPGKIGIKQCETKISDAIKLAGGLLENASDIAEITRFNKTEKGTITERFEINLKKAISGDEKEDLKLQPYDNIVVKSIKDWYIPGMVELSGEVQNPGNYVIEKGERLSSVLKRANGFTKNAYPKGVIFIRESVRQQQQKNINEIAQRLERELFSQSSTEISSSLSNEEIQSKKAIFEQKQKFIEKIKQLRAVGRVYIKLDSIDKLEGSDYDIELNGGDKIIIPQKPSVVNVSGAVMSDGSYVYTSSSYRDYIDKAGGYSYYADKKRTFILKADGSAKKAKKVLFFSTSVEPGDTIVVPEKFETVAWLREIRDITQIITNLALSAGVVIKVF